MSRGKCAGYRSVGDIMHSPVITVKDDDSLEKAARTLVTHGITGAPVVDKSGAALGVISNLDLVNVCGRETPEDLKKIRAKDIMTPFVISVEPKTSVYKAAELMSKEGVHRLFVLGKMKEKEGIISSFARVNVLGIISAKDILNEITKSVVPIKVGNIMHDITLVDENTSVSKAAKIMAKKEIGSIIVAKKKRPIGIMTERDITKKVTAVGLDPKTTKISQVMTKPLTTVPAEASLEEASRIMLEKRIRRLPVTKADKIVGMVSARSMVGGFARYFRGKPALAAKKG